ncbi:MAG: histidinol-phosphate aminotransferase [Parasphingorhabdus sp.]|jgi:histidinol-phosphate aminotransferase
MNPYWSKSVHQLEPYTPGEQPRITNLVKLNTNENPYPPSQAVITAIKNAEGGCLQRYPDPSAANLKQVIADYYGLVANQVFVGNGSDEVLAHIFRGLLQHCEKILFPDISYSFYPVYCGLFSIDYEQVPLGSNFELNIEDYERPNGGIIFPNPNAPTGISLELNQIEQLLSFSPHSVVVVDEAYVDFGAESAANLIDRHDNLVVVQTLSKSRALAGLRVGFAMANSGLIDGLERVKNSFNSYPLGSLAQAGAVASIQDENWFEDNRAKVIESRDKLAKSLSGLGFDILPSKANFLFVTHPKYAANKLAVELRSRAIIVRHFDLPRIDQYLRITIGTEAQCEKLISACQKIMG